MELVSANISLHHFAIVVGAVICLSFFNIRVLLIILIFAIVFALFYIYNVEEGSGDEEKEINSGDNTETIFHGDEEQLPEIHREAGRM